MFAKNTHYEILTPDGWSDFAGIQLSKKNNILEIKTENNYTIKCSKDHKLFINGKWNTADTILINDEILTTDKKSKVVSITIIEGEYDFYEPVEVVKNNQYISNGIVSHNCDFLGSSNTLISASVIGSLVADEPLQNSTETLKIYKEPEPDRVYLMTVDVAEGLDLDDSAFIVFDITEYPIRIMAVFKDNKISPQVYPQVIETIAKHYNDAYILVENNSIGTEVTGILYRDFEYENMVIFGQKNAKIGMRTNKQTKRIGCSNFKDLVENQKLIINDEDIISQISTFIQTGTTYKADIGFKDDLIMACVLLGFYSTTQEFKHLSNANIRAELQKDKLQQLEDEVFPFGIVVRNGVAQDFDKVVDRYGVWVPQKFDRWWLKKP